MPAWTRPIRIPESVEITHAEPPFAIAGEKGSWRIPFRLSKDVSAGSTLKVQLWGGRNNKGATFAALQTDDPKAEGFVAAKLNDGSHVAIQADGDSGSCTLALPYDGLKKGQLLTILLGRGPGTEPGIRVDREHRYNKFFVLYTLPVDDDEHQPPQWPGGYVWTSDTEGRIVAVCTMHILGGPIHHIRAYVPAATRPAEAFDILVRPEDEFGNLSHQELGDLCVSVNGKRLDAELKSVPDSNCLRARVSLSEEGVYRLQVHEARKGCEAVTNPTVCSRAAQPIYWGMIHGHTEMSDGTGTLEQYFHQLKNEVMLDFAASADHDHLWETSDELWATTCATVKRWYKPHEFVTFLGYEWAKWRKNGDGDRNVYYLLDDRPLYRSDDGEFPSPPDLFKALAQNMERAIIIPHHTGHSGNFCDWKDHSPEHERLVEIFQVRGSYECSEKDGNPAPEKTDREPPHIDGYVQNALAAGWRVGFTAGGDDHQGHWGTECRFSLGKTNYKQGLMYVEAREKTREAIFEAMYKRRVAATTGARMLLTYELDGHPMGSELSLKDDPRLASLRKISVAFHGTATVDRADIIRCNSVVHSVPGNGKMDLRFTWKDTDMIDKAWLPEAKYCNHPFAFYYVRVVQTNGEVAWASPVWIDP